MYGENNGTPMFPIFLDENQFQYDSNASMTQLQLFGSIPAACNVDPANYIGNYNISSLNRANKRSTESDDIAMQQKIQISLNNFYQGETDSSASIPNPNAVSTGLRLSYDDDEHNSSVTTASGRMPSLPVIMSLGDNLRTEIERQKEEFDHYIRIQVVKVYVSVFGDDRGKEVAIAGLKSKAKYVRSELGRRMKLRLTPEIRFIEDESLEKGSRVIAILDKLKNENKNSEGEDKDLAESPTLSEEDREWDKDRHR